MVGGKLFEKFITLLGQHEISNEIEYYKEESQDDVMCENIPTTSSSQSQSESTSDENYVNLR